MALEMELETFRRELPRLLSEHPGEFALVHGDKVDGFYPTEDDAYDAGVGRFGVEPFLVKEIRENERVVFSHLDIHPRCRP